MDIGVRRIYVEKKKGFDIEGKHLYLELKESLKLKNLENIRIINCYDIYGISKEEYKKSITTILSEPNVDKIYEEKITIDENEKTFSLEYLPGQYDVRADSLAQCIQILTQSEKPTVSSSKLIIIKGNISDEEFIRIKNYCINPVDSREASLIKPAYLEINSIEPKDVLVIDGFINKTKNELIKFLEENEFAMNIEDIMFCKEYFEKTERRNPTITELKVIDTYWSDHCRHTTFLTKIEDVKFEEGFYSESIKEVYNEYLKSRDYVYGNENRDITLMDLAVIGMKELRKQGKLNDLDVSEEINACSIVVPVDVNGKEEEWLVMFKNETHNHPTEIEPFGGAATCLGGAIRDPLSGRAYVYQAMRVTGSGDPRTNIYDTIPGKLPQRKITTGAAKGYSSYGNQIGLATGHVTEVYDEDFIAKRMEIGAVIGATRKENVIRERPIEGDIILLVGGRTGRDGVGGATGSSKEHTEESILNCGAEVQKGNPPTERKIQRLFRNPVLSKMIKRCNDFGAGGVSVAIGELAHSLEIYLDNIPKKYEGLDGTELALSESQERMAVVIDSKNMDEFIKISSLENLEATFVSKVTNDNRLKMIWRNKNILNISRDFLDTNGVNQKIKIKISEPKNKENYFKKINNSIKDDIYDLKKAWTKNLEDLNICSQKGLVERFDSTIGASSVLMPFGGKYQLTPTEGMVSKIPLMSGETNTCTIMTQGYDPKLAKWSPFHGAMYSVIQSVAKVVAMGGDYKKIKLTFQEYFERLGKDEIKWGKPFSALLGAYLAQKKLNIAAIGGKDSMSGTFNDINVPPTLVSFAVCTEDSRKIISPELKSTKSNIILIPIIRDKNEIPDFEKMDRSYSLIHKLATHGKILSSYTVGYGGIAGSISKMSFGNKIGVVFKDSINSIDLFSPEYGSILLEIDNDENTDELLHEIDYKLIAHTQEKETIEVNNISINIDDIIKTWQNPLNDIFPIKEDIEGTPKKIEYKNGNTIKSSIKIAKPKVFIPVFPGTNCEYDTAKAFKNAGGKVETLVFRNLNSVAIEESIKEMVNKINNSQIIALPGGFSAGDEPDGSGKFIATVFRNPYIKESLMNSLINRDILILGICNGFQALVKLGLLPYGQIKDTSEDAPTLTFNKIGRHISTLAQTKITSNLSPWFNNVNVGDIHRVAFSHGEGRFVANESEMKKMIKNGQIATQYVDFNGNASYDGIFNPNGSINAIEAITSPDGRILGKMGHSERIGNNVCINVPGDKNQKLFEAGVGYFR